MGRAVLIIGQDPDLVDFSSGPPGMTAETVRQGLNGARDRLIDAGHDARILWTRHAETIEASASEALGQARFDVIVIGAGLRTLPPMAEHFERLMNFLHEQAPQAKLAFNSRPDDSDAAALRWIDGRPGG